MGLLVFFGLACVEWSWSHLVLLADWLVSPIRSLDGDASTCLGNLVRWLRASPISSVLSPAQSAGASSGARVSIRISRDTQLPSIPGPAIVLVGWAVVREELRGEDLVCLPIRLRVSDTHLVLFDNYGNKALLDLYPLLVTADLLEDVPDQVLLCAVVFLDIVLVTASLQLSQRICTLLLCKLAQSCILVDELSRVGPSGDELVKELTRLNAQLDFLGAVRQARVSDRLLDSVQQERLQPIHVPGILRSGPLEGVQVVVQQVALIVQA